MATIADGGVSSFPPIFRIRVTGLNAARDREAVFEEIWAALGPIGLTGIWEGSVLAEEAHDLGLETESYTLDAALAPRERDWVSAAAAAAGADSAAAAANEGAASPVELYFAGEPEARACLEWLIGPFALRHPDLVFSELEIEPGRDWNAEWRASFRGTEVPPDWWVAPPWLDEDSQRSRPGRVSLVLNPGAGFGTGTHETTRLCLTEIARLAASAGAASGGGDPLRRALDFGSGSGILAIACALRDPAIQVDAVEIDELAIDNAIENAALNGLAAAAGGEASRLRFHGNLGELPVDLRYRLVVANILKVVLLPFAGRLVERLVETGPAALLLSGLVEADVADVRARYDAELARFGKWRFSVREAGEWRALVWERILTLPTRASHRQD